MKKILLYILAFALPLTGCRKFVELGAPETSLNESNVYNSDEKASATVNYLYYELMGSGEFAQGPYGVGFLGGVSADEIKTYSTQISISEFYQNALRTDNDFVNSLWSSAYRGIYKTNYALEKIEAATQLSSNTKTQLIGELKFMRAFYYFYITNLFGKAPLALSTDYQLNTTLKRNSVDEVYEQITKDLKEAQQNLGNDYLGGNSAISTKRIRPNKAVATALLARVYLFLQDYPNAEIQASLILNDTRFGLENDLNSVFLKTSKEAIWQIEHLYNNRDGYMYTLLANPPALASNQYFNHTLSASLLATFERNSQDVIVDKRWTNWVGSSTFSGVTYYIPKKYKSDARSTAAENLTVMRVAEQVLIRAEARAQQGKLTGVGSAEEDLNTIRARAGVGLLSGTTAENVMSRIERERKLELFTEWGHRWLDIKRWKGFNNPGVTRADEVMPAETIVKGSTWSSYKSLFPIPLSELKSNVNLDQNPGYGL